MVGSPLIPSGWRIAQRIVQVINFRKKSHPLHLDSGSLQGRSGFDVAQTFLRSNYHAVEFG
jgi:hypothetical protein